VVLSRGLASARRPALRCVLPAAIVGALLCAAPAADAQAAPPRDFVGLVSEDVFARQHDPATAATLAAQAALGVGLVRQTFDWSAIERRRGRYRLAYYDDYVAKNAARGIKVLPILFRPPSFRSGAPRRGRRGGTYPPRRFSDLGRFGAVLIKRYGPRGTLWKERPAIPKLPITSWQIWNEPNLPAYWPSGPNPREYVRLLAAAARVMKRADPSAEIVTAGMPESRLAPIRLNAFVAGMYRAGARRAFDTLALNLYVRSTGELRTKLGETRRLMSAHGDGAPGIWITEIGWSDRGPASPFRVGAGRQASLIRESLQAIGEEREPLAIRGVVYYAWRDGRPYPPDYDDFWGLHTGLLDSRGEPKPAFFAFQAAVDELLPGALPVPALPG
jgi:hypothetical protein